MSTATIESLLGGQDVLRHTPGSALDWIGILRRGISSAAVDALLRNLRITQGELAGALGIPERTLARRKKEGTLNPEESAKLLRVARVLERAEQVFEDLDAALDWLKSGNAALGGSSPLFLLDTDIGAEAVMDTLGRIEHGVFA